MSSRYKVHDNYLPHFVTCTVVGWIDALSREVYKEEVCGSLGHCINEKGLVLHAWVIMSNHLHMIINAADGYLIPNIMRDFKKFTSKRLQKVIAENKQESRREWMLNMFAYAGRKDSNDGESQFWQESDHPIALDTEEKLIQRLNYLHNNPVRAGLVWEPQFYKYSSAIDYYEDRNGLLPVSRLVL